LEKNYDPMTTKSRILEKLLEWEEIQSQGKSILPQDLCRDCPELIDQVKKRIKDLRAIEPFVDVTSENAGLQPAKGHTSAQRHPEARSLVTLKVTAGPDKGKVVTFAEHDTFLMGRSKKAHFKLPKKDMYFSRIHFLIEVNPPHCRIMDMGSRNGTFVNGKRVSRADLRDGDRIKAGHTSFRVKIETSGKEGSSGTLSMDSFPFSSLPVPPLATAAISKSRGESKEDSEKYKGARCVVCSNSRPLTSESLCTGCRQSAEALPQVIPGYLVVREIGRGAMGIVQVAVRLSDSAAVAVKTIIPAVRADRAQVQRFLREANILRQLDHPHIVAFRDMGEIGPRDRSEADGRCFFVMDYVRGQNVKQLVEARGPMKIRMALRLICQVLDALAHAHSRRFVHRDIKPSNILIAKEGGRQRAKVADFGLSRVYQASELSGLSAIGDVAGTAGFIPPEQITNYRDSAPSADQYSAAATLYYMLTGECTLDLPKPFALAILAILEKDPVPIRERRPQIPDDLANAIHRALSREPGARFRDVAAFRKALRRSRS
jgi:serine/threonine-protein kinase